MSKQQNYKISDAQFLKALHASAGLFAKTARYIEENYNVRYTRQAAYNRAKNNFAEELEQIREANVDFAEATLMELMNVFDDSTKLKAVQFYLKSMGRTRGYGDKVEHDHKGAMNVVWNTNPSNEESDDFD